MNYNIITTGTPTLSIGEAIRFAARKHKDQYRDDGITPYLNHPRDVARIISQVTSDPEIIAAAWLHDTIEDTDTTFEELSEPFGARVAGLVLEVTHIRTAAGAAYFPALKTREGIMLKFADRLSNISDMDGWDADKQARYLGKSKFWKSEPPQ